MVLIKYSGNYVKIYSNMKITFSGDPGVPGPSVSHTEPSSLQYPVSNESRKDLRFQDSGEDPVSHGSGLTQDGVFFLS